MERKPSNRYQNASQLADDLKSFATQRPVSVRKVGFVQSRVRWSVRHPVNALVLVCCLSLAAITVKVALDVYQTYAIQYADKAREATFRGLMQSMLGDIPATQQTTAELRNFGVAPELLGLMLGQAQLVAGNIEDAVSELKQAQKQRPESEALVVLLAEAYAKSGQLQECFEIEKKLATADPTDIVDRLFHANWLAQKDTPRAIEVMRDIRQNADRHSDLLAKVYVALAYCRLLGDTDNLEYFDGVITLTQDLGEPYALYRLLQFRAMKDADRILQSTKMEEYEYYNVSPDDMLRTIDIEHSDSVASARAWTWQALSLDDSEMRMQAMRRSIDLYQRNSVPVPPEFLRAYILELLLNDRVLEAEEELTSLSKTGASDAEFVTAVTLAQRDGNVSRAAEELAHLPLNAGRQTLVRPVGYLILGMTEMALESFHSIPKSSEQFGTEDHWHRQLLRFAIDELTEEQIVAKADQPQRSNFWMSEAQFFVGMKQLAAGHRHKAKLHLEECLRCGVFTSPEYLYARTILKKWKSTPNWPLWIAVAEEDQPK